MLSPNVTSVSDAPLFFHTIASSPPFYYPLRSDSIMQTQLNQSSSTKSEDMPITDATLTADNTSDHPDGLVQWCKLSPAV